jgi:ABC-type branched-subunit amino acid transport system substrate-binding protein
VKKLSQKLVMFIFLLMYVFPSHAQGSCEAADGESIVLGAIFPQDVLLLSDTSDWWRGTQAMTAAINDCGGVNGRPVEYHYQEAATEDEALSAFASLQAEALPLVVASGFAPVHEGLMQAAENAGVVLWEVTERPTDRPSSWTFFAQPSDREIGIELANYVQSQLIPQLGIEDARLALISEIRPRATAIAEGFRDTLPFEPMIELSYENRLSESYPLSIAMRENEINIVVVLSFSNDADRLWEAMQQADANVAAWLHLGGDDYRNSLDNRIGNSEGMLLVGANGVPTDSFAQWIAPEIYEAYLDNYEDLFGETPNQESNLSAIGVYSLLRELLPHVESLSAEDIRAIMEARPRASWWESSEAALLVEQNQDGDFCILAPSVYTTCEDGLQAFPTWRQRVLNG